MGELIEHGHGSNVGGAREGAGHPPMDHWTPEQRAKVRRAAAYGVPHSRMAQALGINISTLRKHFSEELYDHILDTMGDLAERGYQMAMMGEPQLMKFLLGTHVRMSTALEDSEESKNTTLVDVMREAQDRLERMNKKDDVKVVSEQ